MKRILLLLLTCVVVVGCKTTYEYRDGPKVFMVSSYREFQRLEVRYGELWIKASGVTDDTAEATTSIFNTLTNNAAETGQLWLRGGPLLDMTGQPRSATPAEMDAQLQALIQGEQQ